MMRRCRVCWGYRHWRRLRRVRWLVLGMNLLVRLLVRRPPTMLLRCIAHLRLWLRARGIVRGRRRLWWVARRAGAAARVTRRRL